MEKLMMCTPHLFYCAVSTLHMIIWLFLSNHCIKKEKKVKPKRKKKKCFYCYKNNHEKYECCFLKNENFANPRVPNEFPNNKKSHKSSICFESSKLMKNNSHKQNEISLSPHMKSEIKGDSKNFGINHKANLLMKERKILFF